MPLFRRRRTSDEAAGAAVILTERTLQVRRPKGPDESVAWDDIAMIRVVCEPAPDGGAPVAFLAIGDIEQTTGCVVPVAPMPSELHEWVFGLPGFDQTGYERAVDAAAGDPVTVWVRP